MGKESSYRSSVAVLHVFSCSRVKLRVRRLCTWPVSTKHQCVGCFLLEWASCKPLRGQVTSLASTEIYQSSDHRFNFLLMPHIVRFPLQKKKDHELQNPQGWKKPSTPSSLPSDWPPPHHWICSTKCHGQAFPEHLQGCWFHHLPGQFILDNPFSEEILPDTQPWGPAWGYVLGKQALRHKP